jgi:hypothetical protein
VLDSSTPDSVRYSRLRLKAGCSTRAATVDPGRDTEPAVSSGEEGFPRSELADDSSFFIVWSFPSSLVSKVR